MFPVVKKPRPNLPLFGVKGNIPSSEPSKRSISKEVAKKLSTIFTVPVERFLYYHGYDWEADPMVFT